MYINFQILELDVNQNKQKNVGSKGSHQKCGYVRGNAARCCWLCHSGMNSILFQIAMKIIPYFPTLLFSCFINVLFKFQALEKYNIEKDIAAYIKKEFDKKYNPTWHCIVGRNFGSYVTHETRHFIYFYLGQVAILLFKSG